MSALDRADNPKNITFLLTDVQDSTPMWERDAEIAQRLITRHEEIIRAAVRTNQGTVLQEKGEGDSTFSVFNQASDAVNAAVAVQLALQAESWPAGWDVRVRMAIHTGEADAQYRGTDVNRCARLRGLAHGGQVLTSSSTTALALDHVQTGTTFQDLGEHELRGLTRREHVYQVVAPGLRTVFPPIPGSVERHVYYPRLYGPVFVGRGNALVSLQTALTSGEREPNLVAVTGTGGIGKSALVLEYVRSEESELRVVWWVDASSVASATADLTGLALDLGLEVGGDERGIVTRVHEWLAAQSSWLLIFDNAADPETVADLMPPSGGGSVVVTSRYQDWSQWGPSIDLGGLDQSEAVSLLRRAWESEDPGILNEVTSKLGGHPLALWQAVGFARLTGTGASRYLDLLDRQMTELLDKGKPPVDYPMSAAATVLLSLETLPSDAGLSFDLLGILSYLGPSPIPRVVFQALSHPEQFGRPPGGPAELEILDAVAVLRARSLVDHRGAGALSVHPVVAAVVRTAWDAGDPQLPQHPLHLGLHVIDMVLTHSGEIERISSDLGLIDHAVSVANAATERGVALDEVYVVSLAVARYLMHIGEREAALPEYDRMLSIAVPAFGRHSVQHAAALSNLGIALQGLGRLDESEAFMRKAISVSRRGGKSRKRELAVQMGNLALLLARKGDQKQAAELADEALRVTPKANVEDRAMGLAKKAEILVLAGRVKEGLNLFDQAETMLRSGGGSPEHLLFALQGKAQAQIDHDLPEEARKTLEKAVALAEESSGIESRTTQGLMMWLLNLLLEAGDLERIRVLLGRVPGLTVVWQDGTITSGPPSSKDAQE